jgi:hypothetical protein
MVHIGVMTAYYHPSLCRFENIGVFWRVLFYYPLYGDSSKYIYIKMVGGIIHNYHVDKLITGDNNVITYLGQVILYAYLSVEVL